MISIIPILLLVLLLLFLLLFPQMLTPNSAAHKALLSLRCSYDDVARYAVVPNTTSPLDQLKHAD